MILIGLLIQFIENGGTEKVGTVPAGYIYLFLLFLCQITQNCFLNAYFHRVYRVGLQARSFVVAAIYEKSLKVSMSEQQSSTGGVVNLMSNDAARVTRLTSYGHNLWSSPFQIVVAFTMLMMYIGPSAIVGLVVMALSVPLKKKLAKQLEQLRQAVIFVTDQRVRLINDVLQGIQIIKLYAWENSFLQQILSVRSSEMALMHREIILGALNRTAWNLTPLIVTLATFAVYASTGGEMKASKIFTALSLFRRVRFPLSVFPQMITNLIQFFVASKRITAFLMEKEVGGLASVRSCEGESESDKGNGKAAISIKGGKFQWHHRESKDEAESKTSNEPFYLEHVNLDCGDDDGELCIIVGKVGSGKSSLLSSILGEMEMVTGNVVLSGSISYVPQSSWILNATVKENVIMGLPFDGLRYEDALAISSLIADLDILPDGDQTEIGEKGITLSGGQKQRVSLARAVYADRDIVVLDDPLSALDVHVGTECFENLICGRLRKKLTLLVTHDWSLLSRADRILFVDNHRVVSATSVENMKQLSTTFNALMASREEEQRSASDTSTVTATAIASDTLNSTATSIIDLENLQIDSKDKECEERVPLPAHKQEEEQEKTDTSRATGALTQKEVRQHGAVKSTTVSHYFNLFFARLGPASTVAMISLLLCLAEASNITTNWWLAKWTEESEQGHTSAESHSYWLGVYGLFVLASLFLYFLSQLLLSIGAVNAATRLHDGLLHSLLGAPMSWFESTPSGRTLSRASKDVDEADTLLRTSLGSLAGCMIETLGVLVLVSVITGGWLIIALVPVIGCYSVILQYYRHCSRELKRIESITRSPIFSHFAETLDGLACLRAFEMQDTFLEKHIRSLDTHHRAFFLTNTANRWLSMRLEVVGGTLTLITSILLILTRTKEEAALAGLALVYITQLLNELNWVSSLSSSCSRALILTCNYTHTHAHNNHTQSGRETSIGSRSAA